jgi:hypothetical protein
VGRGGPIYEIAIDSINGRKTASTGSISYPACTIQVGDQVARVWLADPERNDQVDSPTVLRGDAVALREGILIERSWSQAVVHRVTDEELSVGAAVVYVPGTPHPTVVELRFYAGSATGARPLGAAGRTRSLNQPPARSFQTRRGLLAPRARRPPR